MPQNTFHDAQLFMPRTGPKLQHFYHFMLAVLVPMLDLASRGRLPERLSIPSCGPMDRHFRYFPETGLCEIDILDPELAEARFEANPAAALVLPPYDDHRYNRVIFHRVRSFILAAHGADLPRTDVLMIDRGQRPEDRDTPALHANGSGAERRSIPNLRRIRRRLLQFGRSVHLMTLDEMTLIEQIRLFAGSNMIVAQHGAALANLLWSQPGTAVVEILPETQKRANLFRNLAEVMDLDHRHVPQRGKHARVKPENVVQAVRVAGIGDMTPAPIPPAENTSHENLQDSKRV